MMASSRTQNRRKHSHSGQGCPAICPASSQPPKISPSRTKIPEPPIQVWIPNHAQATAARISAARLAPRTPNEARASTGNGIPYLGPACPVSSIGTSTMRLASAMVKTACFQSIPRATSPEASSQEGMLCAMPTHRAVKLYVVQRLASTGTGSRSGLAKRPSEGTSPGASSTRSAVAPIVWSGMCARPFRSGGDLGQVLSAGIVCCP